MSLLSLPFVFLRHGQTDWNRDGRAMGQYDAPLNATGRAQAETARERLRGEPVGAIYSSPLARARVTADIVNIVLNRPLIVIPALAEVRWGAAQGRPRGEWEQAWRDGAPIDGAESFEDFLARGRTAINDVLTDARRFPAPPLIVAHGGIYWAIERALSGQCDTVNDVPNARPLRHIPPARPGGVWRIEPVGV